MKEELNSPSRAGIHHPRLDCSRPGFTDYRSGRPHPGHSPTSRSQDAWSQSHKGQLNSPDSSPSTFEEVESLCLSRSSNDSSLYRHQLRNLPRQTLNNGLGQSQGQFLNGRCLSRQSSCTSTSTSSGNLPEHIDNRQSRSTSTTGSPCEEPHMETLDPLQQFDLNDHAVLDGVFRRVLEWNQAYATMAMGRGGRGGVFPQMPSDPFHSSPRHFGSMPIGAFPPGTFPQFPSGYMSPRPSSPIPSRPVSPGGGANSYSGPLPSGRRVPDISREKTMSPTSDITHVKKRRDLILPDEEEEFSFSRPSSLKPEVKTSTAASTQRGHTATTSSFSSKQASSESMLSSMSSMSQSQDLGWREQFNHDWREAQHAAWRDQANHGCADPYVNPWRTADPSQQMWRESPVFYHPSAPPPSPMMMPPGYQMPSRVLSRGMSIESMSSFGMVSPPECYISQYGSTSQNPAEMMLMNLGFGGAAEGFLPERFMRDWYSKISRTHGQYNMNPPRPPDNNCSSPYDNIHSPYNTHSPRFRLSSKPSYEDLRSASDLHRRIAQPFNRYGTISPTQSNDPPETPTSLLPPSLGKESRTDRLKEYIEAYAHNMSNTTDARSLRIRQFACSRQKSLPSYLETLTEEEEIKSRNTWQKPQDGECRLQAFLREDSLSTASGKSDSQYTSSGGGSNEQSLVGSESDSLSGSDHLDYNQIMSQRRTSSCEQTNCAPSPQPASITSRVLKLQMPNPAERRARLKSDSRNVEGENVPSMPEKRHKQMLHPHDPKHTPERIEQLHMSQSSSCSQHIHNQSGQEKQTSGLCGSKGSSKSSSPKKKHNPKSPSDRPKSPLLLKTRSPGFHRETNSAIDADSDRSAEQKGCPDNNSSDSYSFGKTTHNGIDCNRLFVSQIPLESPVRRLQASPERQSLYIQSRYGLERESCGFQKVLGNPAAQSIHKTKDGFTVYNQKYIEEQKLAKSDLLLSTESLEVADIFNHSGNKHFKEKSPVTFEETTDVGRERQIEPAMISIVLEDVDGNLMENADIFDGGTSHHQRRLQDCEKVGQQDDLLQIPSCSSSISLSPTPLSPVTVIEVSLDNQQDPIDTEDSISSSIDPNEDVDKMCDFESDAVHEGLDSSKVEADDSEFSGVGERVSRKAHSCSLPMSDCRCEEGMFAAHSTRFDPCVDADDGKVSPVLLFSAVSPETSSSSSPSVTAVASQMSDVGIQADDGKLSPLMFFNQEDLLSDLIQNDCAEELYLVSDQAIQCSGEEELESSKSTRLKQHQKLAAMQMCDRGCQTVRLVMYEMSSQTEPSCDTEHIKFQSIVPPEDKAKSNNFSLSHYNLASAKDFNFLHKVHKHDIHSRVEPKRIYSALSHRPFNGPTKRSSPESIRGQSFDSEFWEYMEMDVPLKLARSESSSRPTKKQTKVLSTSHIDKVAPDFYTYHSESPSKLAESSNKETEYSAPSDSYEVVRAMTSHINTASPLGFHGVYAHPGHAKLLSQTIQSKHSVYDSSEELHKQETNYFTMKERQPPSQPCVNQIQSQSKGVGNMPHTVSDRDIVDKPISTIVSVGKNESMEKVTPPNATECFYVKTASLKSSRTVQDQRAEHEFAQVYVSELNFKVSDYRNICGSPYATSQKGDTDFERKTQTVDGLNYEAQGSISKVSNLVTEPSSFSNSEHTYLSDTHAKRSDQEDFNLQHVEKMEGKAYPVKTPNLDASFLSHTKDTDPDIDSGIIDSPTSSSLMSHDEEHPNVKQPNKKDLNFALMRGATIDDFCDEDFNSTEEAREFVLTKFLLRESSDTKPSTFTKSPKRAIEGMESGSKQQSGSKASSLASQELNKVQLSENKSENNTYDNNFPKVDGFDRLMRETLAENIGSANTDGFSEQSIAEKKVMGGKHLKEAAEIKRTTETLERSSFTGKDAIRNLAYDCFLLRERTKPIQCDEKSLPSQTAILATSSFSIDTEEHTGITVSSAETENTNTVESDTAVETEKTDDSMKSSLIDAFVTSILKSACDDLYTDFMEDKQRLQERVKSQLKITGAVVSKKKPPKNFAQTTQEETCDGVDHESETSDRVHCSHTEKSDLNVEILKETASISTQHNALVSEAIVTSNGINQERQDSTSDASSELSVVYMASQPTVAEGFYQTDSSDLLDSHSLSSSETNSLIFSQTSTFFKPEMQPTSWHDCDFRSLSPRLSDMRADLRGFLSPVRNQSADSLDSLRANCSGSIDDILDVMDDVYETRVSHNEQTALEDVIDLPVFSQMSENAHEAPTSEESTIILDEDMSQHGESASDSCMFDLPVISRHRETAHNHVISKEVTEKNNLCVLVGGDHIRMAEDSSDETLGQGFSEPQKFTLKDQILNGENGIGMAETQNAHEPLTDVKLTQLILMGEDHPDFQRLKDLGILTDSFESSPSFTTPDNEINSDIDDQGQGDSPAKSPTFAKDHLSKADFQSLNDTDVPQHLHRERGFGGGISNISDEQGNSESYSDQAAESLAFDTKETTYRVTDCNIDTELDNTETQESDTASDTELVQPRADVRMNVSTQPLPRDFRVNEIIQNSPIEHRTPPKQLYNDHRTNFDDDNVFNFDVDCEEVRSFLSWSASSSATTEFVPMERSTLSPVPDEEESSVSSELLALNERCSRNVGVHNVTSMNFDDCYYKPIPHTPSQGLDHFTDNSNETVSSGEVRETFTACSPGSPSRREFTSTDNPSASAKHNRSTWSAKISEANKRQIRSQLFLSLHPLQTGNLEKAEGRETSKILSAAQRREAYNLVTSDRSGFGISSSFSEENLSSPPLRPRRFQRSLSRESSCCSDASPKRTKRTVSRSSPNFNTGQIYIGNSLHVPNMGESLVSKNTLIKRNQSPSSSDRSLLPSWQSPIPRSVVSSRNNTPSVSRNTSPTAVGTLSEVLLSPHNHSPSSRAPSPIPDVTISSVNQSLELVSFASSPEGSSRESSPPCDNPLQSGNQSPGRITTIVFEKRDPKPLLDTRSQAHQDTNSSPRSQTQFDQSDLITKHSERLSPYRYVESSQKDRSPRLTKSRALISSPDGSPELMTPNMIRSHSSSGDEAGPIQLPVSRTFYSSKHMLHPQSRARLWCVGDRNSSSTESPMPSTPPLSRDHSSTSDSSSSNKEGQSATSTGVPTSTCVSPKSPASDSAQSTTEPLAETVSSSETVSPKFGFESDRSEPKHLSTETGLEESTTEELCVSERSTADDVTQSTDDLVSHSSLPASTSDSDPLKALHLRRSRFQKPENTFSLQQNSSSSDQSSFETSASPRRRFFWATGQITVVSADRLSRDCSVSESWSAGDHTDPVPNRVRSTWVSSELASATPRTESKPWVAGNITSELRDSSSSPSDHLSSDGSPAHSGTSTNDGERQRSSYHTSRIAPVDAHAAFSEKDGTSVKNVKKESTKKSVRHVAQWFEGKGTT